MSNYLLSNEELDDILRKVDIVKVVGNYITLTQKGRNYLGICPFHNDSNPSLTISPEKRIYKCFVCGAGGNAFTFVSDYEKIPFIKAVKTVCAISGIDIPKLNQFEYKETMVTDEEQRLLDLVEAVNAFYRFQLKVVQGEKALNYIRKRQIDDELIERFHLGFALDDGKVLTNYLTSKGFTIDEMVKAGIVSYIDGQAYDMMRGRITFAIKNHAGKFVGYSGRRFDEIKEQKYINTSDTKIFHKSKILYNYSDAALAARKNGYIYIVEGFMDAIALYRSGIDSVVATMGTALTSEHITEIEKLKCEIRFLFDNDRAGKIATLKAIDLVEDKRLKVKVVSGFSEAKDCDELLNRFGKEKLIEAVNQLVEPLDYRLQFMQDNLNLSNHEDRKKFVIDAIKHLNNMPKSSYDEEYYIKKISDISGFSKELIKRDYRSDNQSIQSIAIQNKLRQKTQVNSINRYEKAQRQIIRKMLHDPLIIARYQSDELYMYDDICRRICSYIIDDFNRKGSVSMDSLMTMMPMELRAALTDIENDIEEPIAVDNLFDTIKKGLSSKLEIVDLKEKMMNVSDPKEQAKIAAALVKNKQKYDTETRRRIGENKEGIKK